MPVEALKFPRELRPRLPTLQCKSRMPSAYFKQGEATKDIIDCGIYLTPKSRWTAQSHEKHVVEPVQQFSMEVNLLPLIGPTKDQVLGRYDVRVSGLCDVYGTTCAGMPTASASTFSSKSLDEIAKTLGIMAGKMDHLTIAGNVVAGSAPAKAPLDFKGPSRPEAIAHHEGEKEEIHFPEEFVHRAQEAIESPPLAPERPEGLSDAEWKKTPEYSAWNQAFQAWQNHARGSVAKELKTDPKVIAQQLKARFDDANDDTQACKKLNQVFKNREETKQYHTAWITSAKDAEGVRARMCLVFHEQTGIVPEYQRIPRPICEAIPDAHSMEKVGHQHITLKHFMEPNGWGIEWDSSQNNCVTQKEKT